MRDVKTHRKRLNMVYERASGDGAREEHRILQTKKYFMSFSVQVSLSTISRDKSSYCCSPFINPLMWAMIDFLHD
jgi:hypothetical protein